MPQPAFRAIPLIAAVLMISWIAQLSPHDRATPAGIALPAVARAWQTMHCAGDPDPSRPVLRVQAEDLLIGAAHFDTVRETRGEAAACDEADAVARGGSRTKEAFPPPQHALRVTVFWP